MYKANDHLFNQNRSSMNNCLKLVGFQGLTHYPGQLQTICQYSRKMGDKSNGQSRSGAISLTHSIMTFSIIVSYNIFWNTLDPYSFLYNQLTEICLKHIRMP